MMNPVAATTAALPDTPNGDSGGGGNVNSSASQSQVPPPQIPPFYDITRHNLGALHSFVKAILSTAAFISIDTEFTGLGSSGKTKSQNLAERYTALKDVASTHALVSLGITVFQSITPKVPTMTTSVISTKPQSEYMAHNLNFLLLCMKSHTISPMSMGFLVDNGFDFNRQYREGIPYMPGDDSDTEMSLGTPNALMRDLFAHILDLKVPVVVHNGLLDLMFVYNAFYASLPATLEAFIADLSDMFKGGLMDTKYIADFVSREKASFLAYLFRKYEREAFATGRIKVTMPERVKSPPIGTEGDPSMQSATMSYRKLTKTSKDLPGTVKAKKDDNKPFCSQYAYHGYCVNGRGCPKSHDLDLILDEESANNLKRRRKDTVKNASASETASAVGDSKEPGKVDEDETAQLERDSKRAKIGVEMDKDEVNRSSIAATPSKTPQIINNDVANIGTPTRPIVSTETTKTTTAISTTPIAPVSTPSSTSALFETYHSACFDAYMTGFVFCRQLWVYPDAVTEHVNKMYLMGKDRGLVVAKSAFAAFSVGHLNKTKGRGKGYLPMQKTYDVIIVGAGISGLIAARKCLDAGLDLLVLEARDRVGGRTYTRDVKGAKVDMGGTWFNLQTQHHISSLLQELDLHAFLPHTVGDNVIELESGKPVRYVGEIPGVSSMSLLDAHVGTLQLDWMRSSVPVEDPGAAKDAYKWDSMTVADWVRRNVWTRTAKKMMDLVVRTLLGCDPEEVSLLFFLFYVNSWKGLKSLLETSGAQNMRLEEGAQSISLKLASLLPSSRLILSSAVHTLDRSSADGSVTVFTTSTNIPYRAKSVILATPPTQYLKIKWTPSLPARKLHLFEKWSAMGFFSKAVCIYDTPFWRDAGYSGLASSHGGPLTLVYDTSSTDGSKASLTCFTTSGPGREWADLSPDDRRNQVLSHLKTLFGGDERLANPITYLEHDWSKEEFIGGCPDLL
ncbi:hypothetical protein HDU76_012828 [Blyttiomyces sp. JEL0837]|nr:hypothetical protein HDU76_012828 [Blyttiomyces sp. JEL0837]